MHFSSIVLPAICFAKSQVTALVATTRGRVSVLSVFIAAVVAAVLVGLSVDWLEVGEPLQAVMLVAIAISKVAIA